MSYHLAAWTVTIGGGVLVAQSCLMLCEPMDCNLPGFSVHGIFQVRILEWVANFFSRGSSQPRDRTHVSHISGRLSKTGAACQKKSPFGSSSNTSQMFLSLTPSIFLSWTKLCDLWDLSYTTRDWTWAVAVRALSFNHWTTREFPEQKFQAQSGMSAQKSEFCHKH